MIRVSQVAPKNAVLHWRSAALHPAWADQSPPIDGRAIAGPYVLLADAVLLGRSDIRVLSKSRPLGISAVG